MGQIFAWRPRGLSAAEATARFSQAIECQRALYERAFCRKFSSKQHRVGAVFIAQIGTNLGIHGWTSWAKERDRGLAWAGVCEDFLVQDVKGETLYRVVTTVLDGPERACEWQGSFSAVAWDDARARVAVLTGAMQNQTLWWTDGPDGWAVGSRARPLLEFVGRNAKVDMEQASLYLSFGFLAGTGGLFEHVRRLDARQHVILSDPGGPTVREYVSVPEYLCRDDLSSGPLERTIDRCAQQLEARVAAQLRHSSAPVLKLTGGRDSRCIAAALARAGYDGLATTGGNETSIDVVLAAEVAEVLGLRHRRGNSREDMLRTVLHSMDHARAWTRLSEGVETIRHALHFRDFFEGQRPYPAHMQQSFNGLKPGLNRLDGSNESREAMGTKIPKSLRLYPQTCELFDTMAAELERNARDAGGTPDHWEELFFWQIYSLRWGQDNLLVKDTMTWWWTPLMEKTLLRASWQLPRDKKYSYGFLEAVTLALTPELATVPYDSYPPTALRSLLHRVCRRLPSALQPRSAPAFPIAPERREYWHAFLFERDALVWKDLIDENYIRGVVERKPNADLLWSIATLELFAEVHCVGEEVDRSYVSHVSGGFQDSVGRVGFFEDL